MTIYYVIGLKSSLQRQIDRLIELGAHKVVQMTESDYRDQCNQVALDHLQNQQRIGSLLEIDLCSFMFFDPRLPVDFLLEASDLERKVDFDRFQDFPDLLPPPDDVIVMQFQGGEKYKDQSPVHAVGELDPIEQSSTLREGLAFVALEGISSLEFCSMYLPGSVSRDGCIPWIAIWQDQDGPQAVLSEVFLECMPRSDSGISTRDKRAQSITSS